jgi:transposase InsO family protein
MPKIPEIFRGMEKFQYATTLDLNMGYYSMPLSEKSKQLCTTVLPWGLYRYNALPMGIKPAADIFQERMSHLFSDLRQVVAYMDDLKALGFKDFDDHLTLIKEVLRRLMDAGFQVNPNKCCWFASKVDYLGFEISRTGITPQKNKIQGILNMAQPKNQKDVRRFVGLVNFYRDLYPRRAEILAPLTSLCGKKEKFVWNKEHNEAFLNMKQVMAAETMLTYPNFDEPFVVHTDASNKQIGGVITQNNKPLGFFSKKLTDVQRRYPVTEQELLAITETLKYFRHMLLGHRILIKTDHKNLVHPNSHHASDRVLRQRLLIEEYGAELEYIKGETNTIADTLSRVPTEEIFLLEQPTDEDFPLDLSKLAKLQEIDDYLQAAVAKQQTKYKEIMRGTQKLWAHYETEAIYVPVRLRATLLHWYHDCLQHPGVRRMQATIKQNLYWPGMDQAITAYVKTCALCQQYKITATKKYGKIPLPKSPTVKPWEEVHVDMIGPWTVQFTLTNQPGTTRVEHLQALTIIDKGTGWPEFVATRSKASQHIALLFDGVWLCRYPRPSRVIFDNGGEFTGSEFQELLHSYGVQPVPTTIRNPKSNGVVERVHLTMGDMLRTITFQGEDWMTEAQRTLDAVAWAIRTTVNPDLKYSPCHLAFSQDMLFRRAVIVDWNNVHRIRTSQAIASNVRENKSRSDIQYTIGDKVLLVLDPDERRDKPKLDRPTKGPFTITRVFDNGTVEINRGRYIETINIRRLKPYFTE